MRTEQALRRIWLVRHGSTAWNAQQRFCGHSDIPLSHEGRLQAYWLARRLHAVKIGALYSSDLGRARETAEIIANRRVQPLPIQVLEAWREMDFGAWEGFTYAEIAASFPEQLGFFRNPEQIAPPGGETLIHLQKRVLISLQQIVNTYRPEEEADMLIVSHGGPLRVLLSSILGMPLVRQWQLTIDSGSFSVLDLVPPYNPQEPSGSLTLLNVRRTPILHTQQSARENE